MQPTEMLEELHIHISSAGSTPQQATWKSIGLTQEISAEGTVWMLSA